MSATFSEYEAGLRTDDLTIQEMLREHDGTRTLAVVWMLADRNGRDTSQLPDPARIAQAARVALSEAGTPNAVG